MGVLIAAVVPSAVRVGVVLVKVQESNGRVREDNTGARRSRSSAIDGDGRRKKGVTYQLGPGSGADSPTETEGNDFSDLSQDTWRENLEGTQAGEGIKNAVY